MVYKKCFLRKRNRLENFNYSQGGAYFITVCAKDHRCLFGRVDSECLAFDNDKSGVLLNDVGRIVDKTIHSIESAYKGLVELDKYVVMPNHIHFVFVFVSVWCGRFDFSVNIANRKAFKIHCHQTSRLFSVAKIVL